jgi:tetratricopeptide (TPR) repeat protein
MFGPMGAAGSLIRSCGALALLACAACARAPAAPPQAPPAVAAHEANAPIADCQLDRERAVTLSNDGDRVVKVDIAQAIAHYTRAAELDPSEHRILWKLASAYEHEADWPHVAATLARAVALAPQFANYWFRLGHAQLMLAEAGDRTAFEPAKDSLKKCIAADASAAECHHLLGEADRWTDDEQSALSEYTSAILADPTVGSFYPPLADLYLNFRLNEQAERVLREGVRVVQPNRNSDVALYSMYTQLALISLSKADRAGMLSALEQARTHVDERHPEFLFNLGATLATMTPPEKEPAMQLLIQFGKTVCSGPDAARFDEQCRIAQFLAQQLMEQP